MGLFRDFAERGIDFVREEIIPLRGELVKAGLITPDRSAFDQKASLTDPWAYAQTAFGYKERWSVIDYSKLRQVSYSDPIVAAVILTRVNQIASFSRPQADRYKLGFKISMADREKEPSKGDKARMKELEQFICNCGVPENFEDTPNVRKRDSFETFLRKIVRDSLTFDQINFEVTPRRDGTPYCFNAVDAATIRLLPDAKDWAESVGGGKGKNTAAPDHYMWDGSVNDRTGFDEFEPAHPKYVQVINGRILHTFDEWEMAFGVRNPRTDVISHGYGYSEIEMLITTITSHMNAEAYNRKFFSQGSVIKGIMTFEGTVPPDQLENFRRQWWQQVSGIQNAWKTPIMSLGKDAKLNWVDLQKNNREMEYGKWLEYCIKSICGVFAMDPIEIGFDIVKQTSGQNGGSGGLGQSGDQRSRILFSQERGLKPLLIHIENLINDYIIDRLDSDYVFEFVGLGSKSEKDDLDQSVQEVKSYKTVNEIRAEHDLEPIPPLDQIKSLGDIPLDSGWIQQFGQLQQAAMQPPGAEGGMPGQPGQPGQPGKPPEGAENQKNPEEMSDEEIEAELKKLQGGGGAQDLGQATEKPKSKVKKSITLEL